MASYTEKYKLKKPAPEDFADIADINENMDLLEGALLKKADLDEAGKIPLEQLPESGSDLELGETSDTAYRGDHGKTAYEHSQANGNPHGAAARDIGYTDTEKLGAANVQDAIDVTARMAKTAQRTADDALQAVTDMLFTINSVPTQSGSLTYTGASLSPAWNSYDPNALAIGGTTTAVNAGAYTATFTPKANYKWSDGTTTAKSVTWSIGRASIAVPTQSGSLTYSGSAQSPSWNGYDANKMTIGSTISGTNAGSYTAAFTPKANYRWSDGTVTAKSVTWSIAKAAGSLSLNKTSLSLGSGNLTGTIVVTRAGNGAVTATSGNTSIAVCSVNGTTITVTAKATGSATITVKVAAGTNHNAPANKTCAVTVQMYNPTLAANSWAQIAEASAAGKASSIWKVGDTKDIVVGGETLTLAIMGFNHDDLQSGGKAGITFGLKNLMKTTRQMNGSDSGRNSFISSTMYSWLQSTLLNSLPSDLQAVIKMVNKKTSAGKVSTVINTNAMKLFLFSVWEIFGAKGYSAGNEGAQYSYFATAANRAKRLANGTGSGNTWWTRSPDVYNGNGFCYANRDGSTPPPHEMVIGDTRGVCFGFCV
ncbi:DUF6273 domain-containing protein [Anaerotruncus sp.]|jgi:hypothetical protein|uniref:DUF6273 domain-containing protein n=1 Tax=Anaerotruncus TaxID=244127 RepID=UPI002173A317|nr:MULTISPECIES: DUF6273 domain-containing protein [Anaerotruncus]MCI8493657.1 hypothetical protein [Anaerotruncus sp.]